VDVAAVRPAELDPPQRRRSRPFVVAPVVALVALLVLDAVLVAKPRGRSTHDRLAAAVLTAARQEAVNLTTISYTSAAHDLDRIINAVRQNKGAVSKTLIGRYPVLAKESLAVALEQAVEDPHNGIEAE